MMLFVVSFKLAVEESERGRRNLCMSWLLAPESILELQQQIKTASPGEGMAVLTKRMSSGHAAGGAGLAFFEPKYLTSPMANLG